MPQVVYAEQWGLEPCALPVIVNIAAAHCDTLDFSPLDESSSLIFYNVSKHPCGGRQPKARVLQAGTPLGLMAYLYSRCSPGGGTLGPLCPPGSRRPGGTGPGWGGGGGRLPVLPRWGCTLLCRVSIRNLSVRVGAHWPPWPGS